MPLKHIGAFVAQTPDKLVDALRAQRLTLEAKMQLLGQAINGVREAERLLRSGQGIDPTLYRRIIEVMEMQNSSEAWNKKYESLVQSKVERIKALSPDALFDLRKDWKVLIEDVRQSPDEDSAGPKAQELGGRWLALLERMMGAPVDLSMVGAAPSSQNRDWSARQAAAPDKQVSDFINKVLSLRQ